jgi:hypothetical protein
VSLNPGHHLAHYEIKVLPDEFAQDEERLRRFQREAKVLWRGAGSLVSTQPEFADALGIGVHTLRNWEQGRRAPEGPPWHYGELPHVTHVFFGKIEPLPLSWITAPHFAE